MMLQGHKSMHNGQYYDAPREPKMQGTGKVSLCASVGEGRGDVKPAKNADRFTIGS
ncbi:hypothetical protein ECIAI39_2107 [Escherichia coli IAI39]|uniref:Uncharacterized protein n=1 Tax=Escherichia coli O7:K1 (strain IAI39 / ExPEC) TaxID=585057 RepID=A0A0H3MHI1_ECO7I|nr:hypothetical protein ECIAI39_2107 [Escherichia coli IAI39]